MPSDSGLVLDSVSRNFQSNWAIQDVSFHVPAENSIALLGANGAGKSTLLRLIAGWYPCARGQIHIDGYKLRTHAEDVRRQIMLLEDPAVHDKHVVDSITEAVADYQVDRPGIETEVVDWFEKLDLVGVYGRSARAISKGQRFKISMICLFVVRPKIWLLDEPFSMGLDAEGLAVLECEMTKHTKQGGIVIFSSQWPQHANRLADRALVLHKGKLVHSVPRHETVDSSVIANSSPSLAAVLSGLGHDAITE